MARRLPMIFAMLGVVVTGAALFAVSRQRSEPVSRGHTASYWLRHIGHERQREALEALGEMGDRADPVLLAAFEGRGQFPGTTYSVLYRWMPPRVRHYLPPPVDREALRMAAGVVVLHTASRSIVPELVARFLRSDVQARQRLLAALFSYSPEAPPNPNLVPLFVTACEDTAPDLRELALRCLGEVGHAASNGVPAVTRLCGDPDIAVKMQAARALWQITSRTNAAVPVFFDIVQASTHAVDRHWAASYLAGMQVRDPVLVTVFMDSLTNSNPFIVGDACNRLGEFGAAAKPALARLQKVAGSGSPNPVIGAMARRALARLEADSVLP